MHVERMRSRMRSMGFSQAELAKRSGCTQGTIQQILDGTTRRSRMLPEIARALETTVEHLTGAGDHGDRRGDEDMERSVLPCVQVNTAGNTLRELRREAGLTMDEVARRTGLHKSSLFHWEKGRRSIEIEDAWTLAKGIGAPLSAISVQLARIAVEAARREEDASPDAGRDLDGRVAAWLAARDALAARRPDWTPAEINEAASSIVMMTMRSD